MKTRFTQYLLAALLCFAFATALHADLLNPTNFASLGTFCVTNGAYVTDTDAFTISRTNASSTNVLFTKPTSPNHPQEFYRLVEP